MVTDGFSLGLVWFQDTSLVDVALLCMQEVSFDTWFVLCLVSGYEVVAVPAWVSEVSFDTPVV